MGNVFAAMLAWLSVRSQGGEMVLRMEDLDTQRTSREFAEILRQDLNWLGPDWDRETPAQSSRTAAYDGYFSQLEQMGLLEHRHMEMQMELRLNHMVSYSCYQHLERLLEHSCPGQ